MKRTAILLITLSGCSYTTTAAPSTTQYAEVTLPAATPGLDSCILLARGNGNITNEADIEDITSEFERFADDALQMNYGGDGTWRNELGHIMGYAEAEDTNIYNRPNCGPMYNASSDADIPG